MVELGPRLATERARPVTLRLHPAAPLAGPDNGGSGGKAGERGNAWTADREPDSVPSLHAVLAAPGRGAASLPPR
jgi:hypothetical protein